MKKLFFVWALTTAGMAYAGCTTHSYFYNGRAVMCTTCCDSYGNNCSTFCS